MADDAYRFVIDGEEYSVPGSFRMVDPILIEELTGLTFAEFSERLDKVNQQASTGKPAAPDFTVTVGLVGVSVWQQHEDWTRRKVRQFVEAVDIAALSVLAPEAPDDPEAESPETAPGVSESPGPDMSAESTTTPEDIPAVPV